MTATKSARNAVKHGFCSLHFLAEENRDRITQIRLDLEAIHKPELDEEHAVINDIAIARFKMVENERVQHTRMQEEKLSAGKIYDMQILDEFRELEARWRDSPAHYRAVLAKNIHGCRHLLDHWKEIQVVLRSNTLSPSVEKFCDAVIMHGDHWQIQKTGPVAHYLFSLFLGIQADPELVIDHWITISKCESPEISLGIAQRLFASAPPAAEARQQLRDVVEIEVKQLQALVAQATRQHELERQSFIDKSCGLGLTDPARSNEARLFQRYYVSERNHALKLERKLHDIRKMHLRKNSEKDARKPEQHVTIADLDQLMMLEEDTNDEVDGHSSDEEMINAARIKALSKLLAQAQTDAAEAVNIAQAGSQTTDNTEVKEFNPFARMPAFRHVDWANKPSVTQHEADVLKNCMAMPEGDERNTMIKKYFGNEGKLRRAHRKYTS